MAAIGNLYPTPQAAAGPSGPRSPLPLSLDSGPVREVKMPVSAGFIPGRHGAETRQPADRSNPQSVEKPDGPGNSSGHRDPARDRPRRPRRLWGRDTKWRPSCAPIGARPSRRHRDVPCWRCRKRQERKGASMQQASMVGISISKSIMGLSPCVRQLRRSRGSPAGKFESYPGSPSRPRVHPAWCCTDRRDHRRCLPCRLYAADGQHRCRRNNRA